MELKSRKDKLVALKQFLNLETNEFKTDLTEDVTYQKTLLKNKLNKKIRNCTRCQKLNIKSFTRSVPGWGNIDANIFFIGEAPCIHSMTAQFPFAWKSGAILNVALRLSSLTRYDIFISNSIHCHPPSNRAPTDIEIRKCSQHLHDELQIVKPKLIVSLGNAAKTAVKHIKDKSLYKILQMRHPASFLYSNANLKDYILKLSLEIDKFKK